ncbi:hypothetical protein ACPUER_18065 [Burkholderia sp. DN3021]|uniref:hypothetical protein n=1 Tax=Burkholderia sp. DN3021 TaxID=3410137 RepID=UPI002861FF00|nr:hypothetical protein [Burkholderia ambifaria]MDR6503879.1 hypothetical protein [Burkholderia ambifaria]
MILCKFTAFHAPRGRLSLRATVIPAISALAVTLAGCQDIPIARQRLAELIAPRDVRAVAAVPASGASKASSNVAAPVAASASRSSPSSKPRDWNNPYPLKPADSTGYSLHM